MPCFTNTFLTNVLVLKTEYFFVPYKIKVNKYYILHDHRLLEVKYKIPAKQYHL